MKRKRCISYPHLSAFLHAARSPLQFLLLYAPGSLCLRILNFIQQILKALIRSLRALFTFNFSINHIIIAYGSLDVALCIRLELLSQSVRLLSWAWSPKFMYASILLRRRCLWECDHETNPHYASCIHKGVGTGQAPILLIYTIEILHNRKRPTNSTQQHLEHLQALLTMSHQALYSQPVRPPPLKTNCRQAGGKPL